MEHDASAIALVGQEAGEFAGGPDLQTLEACRDAPDAHGTDLRGDLAGLAGFGEWGFVPEAELADRQACRGVSRRAPFDHFGVQNQVVHAANADGVAGGVFFRPLPLAAPCGRLRARPTSS